MYTKIKNRQKELDRMFEEEGLTDELLKEQIELNKLKHAHNITIEKEMNDGGFVQ